MKQDMELFRSILIIVESSDSPNGCQVDVPGYTPEQVCEHAKQAQEAGLIEARFVPNIPRFHVLRLTYAGHTFLNHARSNTIWEKTKEFVLKTTGSLSLEAVKIALPLIIKHQFGA